MLRSYVVATFTDADTLLSAVGPVRKENFRLHDIYSPYPVHGLDQAMSIRRTRLPYVTMAMGLLGLSFAMSFQFYTNVLDWRVNVGGKPDNSTLAFVPISFELTVLFGALATVAAFFIRARLYPGKRERLVIEGVTDNMFALVLRKPDTSDGVRRACEILEGCGATLVSEKDADL